MKHFSLIISACIAVGLSGYFSTTQLWGYSQSEVSSMFPTALTPIALTFSIWSVIYLSWLILGILQWVEKIKVDTTNIFLLIFAQILSAFWLIPSQSLYIWLSFILMLGIFTTLTLLFFNSRKESLSFRLVVELFYGWILVACIANMHQFLSAIDMYYIPVALAFVSLLLAALYNYYLLKRHWAFVINLVFIWALIWIFANTELESIVRLSAIFWSTFFGTLLLLHYHQDIIKYISGLRK